MLGKVRKIQAEHGELIVMVQPVQYRLGHDRSARAQAMPMTSQWRRHTPWRIGHGWP
jgi:hypothetical protein